MRIHEVKDGNGTTLAMILYEMNRDMVEGVNFVTNDAHPLQVGTISHKQGKVIPAHIHNQIPRQVYSLSEFLYLLRGRLCVEIYGVDEVQQFVLECGDGIILMSGGHGFKVLEDVYIIECRGGPYYGTREKTAFIPKSEVAL